MKDRHGGDWAAYEECYHRFPLDFSANVSPFGPPTGVKKALCQAAEEISRYPDPWCRSLRKALGEHHGISPKWILCGNGASDLLDRLALALRPRRGLVTAPAFSEYRRVLERVGGEVTAFPLRKETGFRVTEQILDEITPDLDVLFLCEPSNPAGRTTDRGLLEAILRRCDACGTLAVVDECFEDFLTDRNHSLIPVLEDHRLLILRAFTKFYGLAGVRLGYCLSREGALLEEMSRAGQSWPVSSLAQAAGIAALREEKYTEALRRFIPEQRRILAKGLAALGCRVIPGEANFLLFYFDDPALEGKLRGEGILLRSCAGYEGLSPGWYRTAVRLEEENRQLLSAMGRCCR